MVKIYPEWILATKGDTIRKPIIVKNNDGTIYSVQEDDIINFGLKETYDDEECLIEKTIDNQTLELVLSHDDTKELKSGKVYVYDIQITKSNGDVHTFESSRIKISEEVYDK